MTNESQNRDLDCFRKCNQEYFNCVKRLKEETVCRVNLDSCQSSCSFADGD